MRRPLIAGNWKMHKSCEDAVKTAGQLKTLLTGVADVEVMIAPPFTALFSVGQVINDNGIAMGGQTLHWADEGAYTGEISAQMLSSCGCRYVLIGHSERRQYFAETDNTINQKLKAAFNNHLVPILCVGEDEKDREQGHTFAVIEGQLRNGLSGFSAPEAYSLVIAYEPVWAIGTGKTASSDQAQEVHQFIRRLLEDMFDRRFADNSQILYGGSVKPQNIAELMQQSDIDGALVGGASLNAETFASIVRGAG